jgi:uncharacterized peroxidase-related enzyme
MMQALQPIDAASATGKTKELFAEIERRVGRVPNMIRTLGHSPAVLEAYLHWNEAFEQTKTNAALRSLISAAVSSANGCDYTLATAFAFGRKQGLSDDQLAKATDGKADDSKTAAALQFALNLVRKRGSVSRSEVIQLQDAGWDDQEIVEIVALVALNIFRNYFNLVAGTELDFPPGKDSKRP